ncbi:MAG: DNA gyrase inhibitor YacG [Gammaproteobacteria bacterium]|nr:DNA gyrase inhibitor YacG [Gammaproteobacteria bacterium]
MTQKQVNCPNCQKPLIWSKENEFRPFCCARCKLLDLGEWASGRMVVPADAEYDDSTAGDLEKD